MAKETLEKAYALVEKLTSKEKVDLKEYIQKSLDARAKVLQDNVSTDTEELDLITGKIVSNSQ